MKRFYILLIFSLMLAATPWAKAQRLTPATDTTQRVHCNVSLFTGVYSAWGETHAYTGAAPTITYRANDRLTLKAGFAVTTDMNANGYRLRGQQPRSYVPYRTTTGATGVSLGAEYQVNDNLWVAARAFYLGGSYDPIWNFGQAQGPMELSVYGASVAMHYRTKNDNGISLYFNYVNDRTGALLPALLCHPAGLGLYGDPMLGNDAFGF